MRIHKLIMATEHFFTNARDERIKVHKSPAMVKTIDGMGVYPSELKFMDNAVNFMQTPNENKL